jgi:hypothetical protein
MPDWQRLVEERLGRLKLSPVCEREVIAELAAHLEERRATALREGRSDSEALAMALEEVPDWTALNADISATRREEDRMSEHTKTIVIPGMTMLISSAILGMLALTLLPPIIWVEPRTPWLGPSLWLFFYLVVGGVGAYWSRRAGGDALARFYAGVFPAALHLWIFVAVVVATLVVPPPGPPQDLSVGALAIAFAGFVIAPAIALALGTLPFLRDGKPCSAPLPAVR